MIQAEYGWRDEEVLDLPVCRLRQIAANIEFRIKANRDSKNSIVEWQTQTLATFIASTIQMERKGQKNPVLEAALKIRLDTGEKGGQRGSADDTPIEDIIENGSRTAENSAGSYEKLMAGFSGR